MSATTTASGHGPNSGLLRALSDERLTRRAVDGDERAFAAIFNRYHQRLYRFCLAIVGNPEDAQDALQNTMVKVLRALPGEQRRIDLKPWLYRIAHNEAVEVVRRRRETRELGVELPATGPGLAEEAGTRERLRLLLADLEELPERQRETLVMRELAGLDFAEIGAALGTSAAVARQTLYEARLGLRQMDEGREMSCASVTRALSDGDGRVARRRDLRSHLRSCPDCRRFREEIGDRSRDLAALSPLPAAAAASLLHGVFGAGGGGGGGLAAGVGGGAAKTVGAAAAMKGAAAVAVIAAVGVTAADRGGVIDVGLPGGGASRPALAPPDATMPGRSGLVPGTEAGAIQRQRAANGVSTRARVLRGGPSDARGAATTGMDATSPAAEKGDSGGAPDSASPASSPAHPHGRDHEKWHPSAAGHGQQTAAEQKAAEHGSSGTKGHGGQPASPAHPAKPPHPAVPSPEKGASASPNPPSAVEGHPANSGRAEEAPVPAPPASQKEAPPRPGQEEPLP